MPTDDPRAAAIEAVLDRRGWTDPSPWAKVQVAEDIRVAVPHLTRDLRALADDLDAEAIDMQPRDGWRLIARDAARIRRVLDAIEASDTTEED